MNSIDIALGRTDRRRQRAGTDLATLFGEETSAKPFDWTHAHPDELAAAVVRWTDLGNAITFGRTSDGGAVSVTLLAGGQRHKLYAADEDALSAILTRLRDV